MAYDTRLSVLWAAIPSCFSWVAILVSLVSLSDLYDLYLGFSEDMARNFSKQERCWVA